MFYVATERIETYGAIMIVAGFCILIYVFIPSVFLMKQTNTLMVFQSVYEKRV